MERVEVKVFPKGIDSQINKYLNIEEMECSCESSLCHFTLLDPRFAESFYNLRKTYGAALWLSSGFRCQSHNMMVGGKDTSKHTMGMAGDILFPEQLQYSRQQLVKLAKPFFDVVIPYYDKGFMHCHNNLTFSRFKGV